MPYVEMVTSAGKTVPGTKYYTPESEQERVRRDNGKKAAARLRQLLQKNYEGEVTVTISYEPRR